MPHDAPWEHYHGPHEHVGGHDDVIVWTTVGVDVGSSTSQLAFSRIVLARHDSHYVVEQRSLLHESEVILTPLADPDRIDGAALAVFIQQQHAAARIAPGEIDTGAVILTGLALGAANARAVADALADASGKFIAVSAGDLLEARLAANGAGVPALSAATDGLLVHIDIGGGTTKFSAWRSGRLVSLAAIDVGARLVTIDETGRIATVQEPAARVRADLDLDLHEGLPLAPEVGRRLAGALARNVLRYAGVLREPPRGQNLLRTPPLFPPGEAPEVSAVVFSGGVSEYVYGRETRSFGDLGLALGREIREAVAASGVPILPLDRGIRATVAGVSQHSAQLSGATLFVSDETLLPLHNLPMAAPRIDLSPDILDQADIAGRLEAALSMLTAGGATIAAFGVNWAGSATYERLGALAGAIASVAEAGLPGQAPAVVVVQGDVAGVLGARLHQRLGGRRPVICLDGVHVHDLDHIDIGRVAPKSRVLPVVVKSLLFASKLAEGHHG